VSRLHMVEIRPDLPALLRFLHGQGLDVVDRDEDLGYGVHAWLAAAFGQGTIRPWRLFYDGRRPTRVLGYTSRDASELREHLAAFAEPSVYAVVRDPENDILTRPLPTWRPGMRLAFEVQCCPVGRKSRSGVEKDLFLIAADHSGGESIDRESVYTAWAAERLERDNACTVRKIRLDGFRLVRQLRQTQPEGNGRSRVRLVRPMALIRGELIVGDPDRFNAMLAGGIGRHVAFGYGMVLLSPPS